jgi:hypothetical protein
VRATKKRTAVIYGALALAAAAWGAACGTQFMARALGFDAVLGEPLFDVSGGRLGGLAVLSHVGGGFLGAGVVKSVQWGHRRWGAALLAVASVCWLLAVGPTYSPVKGIEWGGVIATSTGEDGLHGVLRGGLLWGAAGWAWAMALGHVAIAESRKVQARWRTPRQSGGVRAEIGLGEGGGARSGIPAEGELLADESLADGGAVRDREAHERARPDLSGPGLRGRSGGGNGEGKERKVYTLAAEQGRMAGRASEQGRASEHGRHGNQP